MVAVISTPSDVQEGLAAVGRWQGAFDLSQANVVCVFPEHAPLAQDFDTHDLFTSAGCRVCVGAATAIGSVYRESWVEYPRRVATRGQGREPARLSELRVSEPALRDPLQGLVAVAAAPKPWLLQPPFWVGDEGAADAVDIFVVSNRPNQHTATGVGLDDALDGNYLQYLDRVARKHRFSVRFRVHVVHVHGFALLLPRIPPGSVLMTMECMLPYRANVRFPDAMRPRKWAGQGALYSPFWKLIVEHPTPLTLLIGCDYFFGVNLPKGMTQHKIVRTAWDARLGKATMDPAAPVGYLPFGTAVRPGARLTRAGRDPAGNRRWEARRTLFNFHGSLSDGKPTRADLRDVVNAHRAYFDELARVVLPDQRRGTGIDFEVTDPNVVFAGDSPKEKGEGKLDYVETLQDSVFTLCPMGDLYESYRIWEAVELGSIPVLEDPAGYKGGARPAQGLRDIDAPFVFVEDWGELPVVMAEFAAFPGRLTALQQRLRPWLEHFERETLDGLVRVHRRPPPPALEAPCSYVSWSREEQVQQMAVAAKYWALEPPFHFVRTPHYFKTPVHVANDAFACFDVLCSPTRYKAISCSEPSQNGLGAVELNRFPFVLPVVVVLLCFFVICRRRRTRRARLLQSNKASDSYEEIQQVNNEP